MIVPFAILVLNPDRSEIVEDRSEHYLITEFNRAYQGKLTALPAWPEWEAGVRELAPLAAAAFTGKANLHLSNERISHLADAYEKL